MLIFDEKIYYIDLKRFEEVILALPQAQDKADETKSTTTVNYDSLNQVVSTTVITETIKSLDEKKIDNTRYSLVYELLQTVLDPTETEGKFTLKDTSLGFKIAFNTLLAYKILTTKKYNNGE